MIFLDVKFSPIAILNPGKSGYPQMLNTLSKIERISSSLVIEITEDHKAMT